MLIWCVTLFALGVLAFLDSLFNYGDIFRRINTVLFMLLSLGLLVRTSMMMKLKKMEKLTERNVELQQQLNEITKPQAEKDKEPEKISL